jgi:malate/lactate dehydrogenase
VGRGGVIDVLELELSDEEQVGLENSAKIHKAALEKVSDQ